MKNYPSIKTFISYVGTFRTKFLVTLTTFALADVVLAAIPWLIGQLTHSLAEHTDAVMLWTILLIVSSIGHDILWRSGEFMYLKLLNVPSQRFDDIVFGAVVRHNYGYFVDKFTGKLSSYANSLGREFRELLDNTCYNYINLVVTTPIIIATMFTVNVYTGIVFVIGLLLMFVVGRKLARIAAKAERVEADKRSNMDGYVVDTVANFVSVKAFGSERREAARIYHQRRELVDASNNALLRAIWFWGVMSLGVRWVIWPSTFVLNVYLYTHGQLSLAQMTTFLTAIILFSNFIWEVIWNISQVNIKIARIEEAYRYLFGTRNIIAEADDTNHHNLSATAFKTSLELRNVQFAYPDKPDVPILKDVNLTIRQGEKIGVVGPSGGGKSTLLKLLLGYYPMQAGSFFADGEAAHDKPLTDLLAYVPQDTTIFHRTIADNIAYTKPDATKAEIIAAAKHAEAHDFITNLASGYDTLVGERGVKLSGGQRQRIAIARALLKDAPLLLLDEATSALDSESEKLIQKALWDLLDNRTALVIAHRLSTIQRMDRIIVFDHGQIIEEGTHQQLIKNGGMYATLWAHQSGGFIED